MREKEREKMREDERNKKREKTSNTCVCVEGGG
jgi:hypothetical protein